MGYEGATNYVRIRGLPWQSSREDVLAFFEDCKIKDGVEGVHMTLSPQGRPSGEAYIELENEDEVEKAIKKHKKTMGSRYIEVFQSNKAEVDWILRRTGKPRINLDPNLDGFIRLRGLPFDSDEEDIRRFFEGLEIVDRGILMTWDQRGRPTGEAYVQFATKEMADKAMAKHREKIGHRYIEIFKSTPHEFFLVSGHKSSSIMSDPMGRQGNFDETGGPIHMGAKRNYGMSSNRPAPYDRDFNNRNHGSLMNKSYLSEGGTRRPYSSLEAYDRGPTKRFAYRDSGVDDFDRYDPTRHIVHMRGLPYKATDLDIIDFFAPYEPVTIRVLFDESGRPSGKADVEFKTHEEAEGAMSKDNSNMHHRYIELFLHSRPSGFIEQSTQDYDRPDLQNLPSHINPNSNYSNSYHHAQTSRHDYQSSVRESGFNRSNSTRNSSSGTYLVRLPPSATLSAPRFSLRDFLRSRVH
ncbi:heterogeneous nuclear ribonucleoprotein F-like isoform X1 [Brevipalpus obovatus]|uniref:heterogeneous nuclear ribonucleoprotein F-like isoform X1 n=1 Tax=Brevipalpus obovatus TaxID=246614 RepID=UPI003D9ECAB4